MRPPPGRADRAERRKVMALAQRREIDAVLVTELLRWGRSTLDLLHTLQELEAWRVSVIAMSGLAFDLATAHGRMLTTIVAGIAEFERELHRERVRSGMAAVKTRQAAWAPTRTAAEVGPAGTEGPRPRRAGPQLPPDRARARAEQEHHRRHCQAEPGPRRGQVTGQRSRSVPRGVLSRPFFRVNPSGRSWRAWRPLPP